MIDYKEMYRIMFRGSEKARRTLLEEKPSYETAYRAVKIIEKAQLDSENLYLLATENLTIDQETMEDARRKADDTWH